MKSFLMTLIAVAAVAYAGAFFEVWELKVLGDDPLTAKDVGRKLGHFFDFTDDLREIRDDLREKNENIFANKSRSK